MNLIFRNYNRRLSNHDLFHEGALIHIQHNVVLLHVIMHEVQLPLRVKEKGIETSMKGTSALCNSVAKISILSSSL